MPQRIPPCQPQQYGNRNPHEIPCRNTSAACQAGKGSEKDNNEYIIYGCACHNHLRDALFGPIALLHELQHTRYNYRWRNRSHHSSHNGSFQQADSKKPGRQKQHACDLKGSGDKTQKRRRSAYFL